MISIRISPGEAYDRLSILQVKLNKISDPVKLDKVRIQYRELWSDIERYNETNEVLLETNHEYYNNLIDINTRLWDVEDDIRECESKHDFSDTFIQLARSVYHINDERHRAKLLIDQFYKSPLAEQKAYTSYEKDSTFS